MRILNRAFRFVALLAAVMALTGCGGGGGGAGGSGGGGQTPTSPNPPSNLSVVRGAIQLNQFTLSWSPSAGAVPAGYRIYRKFQTEGSFKVVGETSGATAYVDTAVTPTADDDILQYFVTAYNLAGESSPSNTVTVSGLSSPPPPPPPSGF